MSGRAQDIEQGAGDIPDEDLGRTDAPEETNDDAADPVEERTSPSTDRGASSQVGSVFRSGG